MIVTALGTGVSCNGAPVYGPAGRGMPSRTGPRCRLQCRLPMCTPFVKGRSLIASCEIFYLPLRIEDCSKFHKVRVIWLTLPRQVCHSRQVQPLAPVESGESERGERHLV